MADRLEKPSAAGAEPVLRAPEVGPAGEPDPRFGIGHPEMAACAGMAERPRVRSERHRPGADANGRAYVAVPARTDAMVRETRSAATRFSFCS